MPEIPSHVLMIATVGGAPEPLVASIKKCQPAKVLFVPSSGTANQISRILDLLTQHEYDLREGACETIRVADHQDFSRCVREMRDGLEPHVIKWRARGDGYSCVADFTGGTKCMSAALTLVARPWPDMQFSYVGGTRRDKHGVGVVVSGDEQVVRHADPWEALGYQVVEEAVAAFNCHAYDWGVRRLKNAVKYIDDQGSRKNELSALATFMEGYALWDRPEYGAALGKFKECGPRFNNLAAALPDTSRDHLHQHVAQARCRLEQLQHDSNHLPHAQLEDLIANAARRRKEGRHVDAVARLYRAIEAAAQLRLQKEYGIYTGKVSLEEVPEPMRGRLEPRAEDGRMKLGLQDAYEVLLHKEDPLGKRFDKLDWRFNSPLSERNESIAGHGFKSVSPELSDTLWKGALSLAEFSEQDIFEFPKLGATWPAPR